MIHNFILENISILPMYLDMQNINKEQTVHIFFSEVTCKQGEMKNGSYKIYTKRHRVYMITMLANDDID